MSPSLWGIAAIIGVVLFGLGMLVGWVWYGPGSRGTDKTERRVNSLFSAGFAVIGLAILVNVIVLSSNYRTQVACNSDMVGHLRANAEARRDVIRADIEADLAVVQYLDTERHHQGVIPVDAPAVTNLINKVLAAHDARVVQLQVYDANRYTTCTVPND